MFLAQFLKQLLAVPPVVEVVIGENDIEVVALDLANDFRRGAGTMDRFDPQRRQDDAQRIAGAGMTVNEQDTHAGNILAQLLQQFGGQGVVGLGHAKTLRDCVSEGKQMTTRPLA